MSLFHSQRKYFADNRQLRHMEVKLEAQPVIWRQRSPHRRWFRRAKPIVRLLGPTILAAGLVAVVLSSFLNISLLGTGLGEQITLADSFSASTLYEKESNLVSNEGTDDGSSEISLRKENHHSDFAESISILDSTLNTRSTSGKVQHDDVDKYSPETEHQSAGAVVKSNSEDSRSETDKQLTMPASDREELEAVMDTSQVRLSIISSPDAPVVERPFEQESTDHLSLEDLAEHLPDLVHVPFEDVIEDEQLAGWEDQWISSATYNSEVNGPLTESKIDFIYLWVNGSEQDFQDTKHPWELKSVLNDAAGKWIGSHGVNRYRDWDELRYSFRSLEKNAGTFRNNIQVLVNSIGVDDGLKRSQTPNWLDPESMQYNRVQVLAQEDYFDEEKKTCLPTFNSLTMENQIFNTPSTVDEMFTMSDDMLLTTEHAASDIHTPLFGPVMSFKTNAYNTKSPPTSVDAARFGEKPYLIYTSWLLNRRFGFRKRKGQSHFGHALSRKVMKEAINAFPGPELRSACKRFRGEPGFQLYSWYAAYHYLIERHREALLWSYIILRSDVNADGMLSWDERQTIISELEAGMENANKISFRRRNFYHVPAALEKAGLQPPKVHTSTLWTSLDGPVSIQGLECENFDVNECLAPGFSTASTSKSKNHAFSSALVFDRLARQNPECGDCLIKIILSQQSKGMEPILPDKNTKSRERQMVIKALMRYKYIIVDPQSTLFAMVTDADQIDSTLTRTFVREGKPLPGQMCLNDDVEADDPRELGDILQAMTELFTGLFPEKSVFEL